MALNATGQISLAGITVGQSIELELGGDGTTQITLDDTAVRALAGIAASASINLGNFYGKFSGLTQRGILAFGAINNIITSGSTTYRLLSSAGVISLEATTTASGRYSLGGCGYGLDKGIFGYGNNVFNNVSITNLVSNTGAIATDTTGVGTARYAVTGIGYGKDKGLFGFGRTVIIPYTYYNLLNLIGNTGVVATDTTQVSTAERYAGSACKIGVDQGIYTHGVGAGGVYFMYKSILGNNGSFISDALITGVGKTSAQTTEYGTDKGLIFSGYSTSMAPTTTPAAGSSGPLDLTSVMTITNTGVLSSDTAITGGPAGRDWGSGCSYGGDKGSFSFGNRTSWSYSGTAWSYPITNTTVTNLVSNTGVIASDITQVGSKVYGGAACGYSSVA